jgi:hypothetical protein
MIFGLSRLDVFTRSLWGLTSGEILVVALTLLASMLLGGRPRDVLALQSPTGGWSTYIGAALAVLPFVVLWVGIMHGLAAPRLASAQPMLSSHWLMLLGILVLGPLSDNLLFRGFLLSALSQTRLGYWGAALVSIGLLGVLRGRLSYPLVDIIGIAAWLNMELVLAWLLWRTGSLRVTIIGDSFAVWAFLRAVAVPRLVPRQQTFARQPIRSCSRANVPNWVTRTKPPSNSTLPVRIRHQTCAGNRSML